MNRRDAVKGIGVGVGALVGLGGAARPFSPRREYGRGMAGSRLAEGLVIRASWYEDCFDPRGFFCATVLFQPWTRLRLWSRQGRYVDVVVDARGPDSIAIDKKGLAGRMHGTVVSAADAG